MPQYSPFNKPITDLQPSDLAVLKSVSEGWYVDYKRDLIDAGGMAKALSAFANSYGGWLFFGIKERSKDDPVAGEFCGLSVRDVDVAAATPPSVGGWAPKPDTIFSHEGLTRALC